MPIMSTRVLNIIYLRNRLRASHFLTSGTPRSSFQLSSIFSANVKSGPTSSRLPPSLPISRALLTVLTDFPRSPQSSPFFQSESVLYNSLRPFHLVESRRDNAPCHAHERRLGKRPPLMPFHESRNSSARRSTCFMHRGLHAGARFVESNCATSKQAVGYCRS